MSSETMHKFINQQRKPIAIAGATIAIIVAAIYYFVVPDKAASTTGIQNVVLAYGHSLCWVLLATASALQISKSTQRWSVYFAYSALGVYAAFFTALVI